MPNGKLPDSIERQPEDFAAVLATDDPLFLVGRQAVNLWALYYRERTADLAPFVSRDVDVLGNRETLSLPRAGGSTTIQVVLVPHQAFAEVFGRMKHP